MQVDNHNATIYSFRSPNGTLVYEDWIVYTLDDGNPRVDVEVETSATWTDSMVQTLHIEKAGENNSTNNELSKELLSILAQLHPAKDDPGYLITGNENDTGVFTYLLYYDGSMYCYPMMTGNKVYSSPPKGVRPSSNYQLSLDAVPTTILEEFIHDTKNMLESEERQKPLNITKEQFINLVLNSPYYSRDVTYDSKNDTLIMTGATYMLSSQMKKNPEDFIKYIAKQFRYTGPLPKMVGYIDVPKVKKQQPAPW
ncbi:MAG: hypothetical protein ABR985_11450 [Methanotrichaceae archaeon]